MIWIYMLINALALFTGFRYVRRVGARQVIPFVVCLLLLSVYCLLTPVYFYLIGRETVTGDRGVFQYVGRSILGYYEQGMLAYAIANACFVAGFMWWHRVSEDEEQRIQADKLPQLRRFTVALYGLFTTIVLVDIIASGINPMAVLFGETDESVFSSQSVTNTYYFRAFADSIITTIVLYAYLSGSRAKLVVLIVPAFVLFALLGFRYRLILTVMGLVLVYGLRQESSVNLRRWLVVSLMLVYFIATITYNRWYFISGQYNNMTANPTRYDYAMFFEQTRGSLADFNLLRYYDENLDATHDYGLSMFGYIVVRIIPRQFFPGGEKPYPPPFLEVLDRSLELPRGWSRIGEATLHYGAFYAGFGWAGFVLIPFLMGLWISFFVRHNSSATPLGFLKQIVLALALFQLITRGYLPQFVDHYVYLFIPLWLVSSRMRGATNTPTVQPVIHEAVY